MKNFPISFAALCVPAVLLKLLSGLPLAAIIALLALTAPLMACSPSGLNGLQSQVSIEVGKQFELGGKQLLGFRVEAHNVGPVAVEIKEITANGRATSFGLLQPGQQTKAAFGMGSKAILVNLGSSEAKIDVNISNGAGLGMSYAAAQPSVTLAPPGSVTAPALLPSRGATAGLAQLLIPAGRECLLGGGQAGGFTFVGTNVGAVAVQVRERTRDGQTRERGLIAPGQAVELQFGAGLQALLFNNNGSQARLKIDAGLLDPRELDMTYRQVNK